MTIIQLIIVTSLLTVALTYVLIDSCDRKQLVKLAPIESVLFVLFVYAILFSSILFFLAAMCAVIL